MELRLNPPKLINCVDSGKKTIENGCVCFLKRLILWFYTDVTTGKGVAGRIVPGDIIDDEENPKFGFYWWFWKPNLSCNGGRVDRREVVDINLHWLCFWCCITSWPRKSAKQEKIEQLFKDIVTNKMKGRK